MSIRNRFLYQNALILAATIFVTVLSSYIFSGIYGGLHRSERVETVLLAEHTTVADTLSIGAVQIREILIAAEGQEKEYTYNNIAYFVKVEKYKAGGVDYTLITLTPRDKENGYNQGLIRVTLCAFGASFAIALFVAWVYNGKHMVCPIENLQRATNDLVTGKLDKHIRIEGEGEVRALAQSVELLRQRLLEADSERNKAEEERKFLISSISHDLKTPVAAVRGYIEGVQEGIADTPEKKQQYLEKAVKKTTLLTKMIEDLLLYARLDMQQIQFTPERTEIGAYVQDVLEDRAILTAVAKLENTLHRKTYVSIDRVRFARVLQNILDNANKYAGESPVTVSLYETKASVIIAVTDTGCGIPKDAVDKIFTRFYRVNDARTADGSGGLGLAIAKQLTEGLGGKIWAVSEEGKGTSIRIALPKEDGDETNPDH
ncbi:MAG: ATP-binding protein [Clostridia bacterium]|nr:ATP-binding protein [Clostridia bacterium]